MFKVRLVAHGPPNCAQTQPSERLGSSLCGNGLHSLIDISENNGCGSTIAQFLSQSGSDLKSAKGITTYAKPA
jgi:hypothetical protein